MTILHMAPGGGGDHTTIQAAVDALGAGDHEIICYEGDAGGLTLSNATPTSIVIRAAAGHRHDGRNNGNTGIAHAAATWGLSRGSIAIEGIAFAPASSNALVSTANGVARSGITISGCRFVQANAQPCISLTVLNQVFGDVVIHNNVLYQSGAAVALRLSVSAASAGASMLVDCAHNTLRSTSAGTYGLQLVLSSQTGRIAAMTATSRNNAAFDFATADFAETASGTGTNTFTTTHAHNASSDATADDFGGSGHLVDQVAADWFANVATDLRKRTGSPGIRAGVTLASVPTDFRGQRREGRYDIGFDQRPTLGDLRQRRLLAFRE